MKLSKIYASDPRFIPINFKNGLNIIFGDVEKNPAVKGKDEHNLGKTALVELINFLLLKKSNKKQLFVKHKQVFENRIFFLELELNNGQFLTIRRSVESPTKISLKIHENRDSDFTSLDDKLRDYLKIGFAKAKGVVNSLLGFDVLKAYEYRAFMAYFLRTQNDYGNIFQMNTHKGKHSYWKSPLLSLLGFDNKIIEEKYTLDERLADNEKAIDVLSNQNNGNEYLKIKSVVSSLISDREAKEAELGKFDFYQADKSINLELVNEVEEKINKNNNILYGLEKKLNRLRTAVSHSLPIKFDIDKLDQLFEELNIYFPKNLVKDYEQVKAFYSDLTSERNVYLKKEIALNEAKKLEIDKETKELNKRKDMLLTTLKEKDTFKKYVLVQQELIELNKRIDHLEGQLDNAQIIEKYKDIADEIREKIKDSRVKLTQQISDDTDIHKTIKELFEKIYSITFDGINKAVLSIYLNEEGNIEFDAPILNGQDPTKITGKGDGYTSTKVLCASLVLSILVAYSKSSFIRFSYNDGILESWGDGLKKNFLKFVKDLCEENDIQYIISIIKTDVPEGEVLDSTDIVRTLSKSDTLFGINF